MANRTLLLVSVLCLVLLFAEAHTADDKINSIIAKYATQWRNKIKHHTEPSEQLLITEHKCIHDTYVNPLMERTKEKLRSFAEKNNLLNQHKKMVKTEKATEYQNMRFFMSTTKIAGGSADPNRACYNIGSTVCLVGWDVNYNLQCTNYVCESEDILSNNLQTFFRETVLPTLSEIFTEVIQVPKTSGNLILDPDTWAGLDEICFPSDVPIPESYTTSGIPDSDFAAFVTARPCDSDGTVAYAAACNYEVTDFDPFLIGRPLAGIINFCPRYFQQFVNSAYTDFELQGAIKVAVHELTHALGFSSFMYDSYVDENGDHYSEPVRQITRTGTSPSGDSFSKTILELQTPKLMAYARDHYGCSSLDGVELEDIGGSGTAGSHWELRVAGDGMFFFLAAFTGTEYMCGYINPSMPVSGLTLSLFEDMGWYRANLNKADYWGWGKDQGCDFLQDRCESSWPDADKGYWCSQSSAELKCTPDHKAKGQCIVGLYSSNLPAYYQHFSNRQLGGSNPPADYCPFYESAFSPSDYCVDPSHTGSTSVFETYSTESACFHVIQGEIETPVCYSYDCTSETHMTVTINGDTFDCPSDGGQVSVDSVLSGANLECPPAELLCRTVSAAMTHAASMLVIGMGLILVLVF